MVLYSNYPITNISNYHHVHLGIIVKYSVSELTYYIKDVCTNDIITAKYIKQLQS